MVHNTQLLNTPFAFKTQAPHISCYQSYSTDWQRLVLILQNMVRTCIDL